MSLNPLRPFNSYLRPYKRQVIYGLILLFVSQAIQVSIPLVLMEAIDAGKGFLDAAREGLPVPQTWTGSTAGDLAWYAILLTVLGITSWCANFGLRWYFSGTSRYVERDLRTLYVRHIVNLPMSFFQESQVGDLMARATNDVEAIQRFLEHAFRMALTGVMTFFLSLALMCTIDWSLAVLALLPMPIMVGTARLLSPKMRRGYRRIQEQFGSMSSHVQENLSGMRVVKAFARREAEIDEFTGLNDEYVARNRWLIWFRSLFYPYNEMLNGLSMLVVLWLGGVRVMDGALTLGAFVAFNAYLTRMSRTMEWLGRMVDEFQRALASLSRIEAILNREPQVIGVADPDDRLNGDIEFRDVSFAYNGRPVLEDINVRIPAGSTLAIVGRVGSGKTTLARMIPRLIHADQGEVLIDGKPVREFSLKELRQAVGYVPQETFLFSATLRENVALGAEDDKVTVERASEVSQLTPDLEVLPDRLETIVGERGVTLSGGQRQRTALARAVIRHPSILILDDAMSSVDTRTEELILRELRGVMSERTTILIAHRISTVKDADFIIVMDEGRIVEEGSHDQLVALDGIYADMFRRQHLTAELDEL
jgi:ATP-binding cassette subfamily B protein